MVIMYDQQIYIFNSNTYNITTSVLLLYIIICAHYNSNNQFKFIMTTIIKRGVTPLPTTKAEQPSRQPPRRVFGKDLKNIIASYNNKLSESGTKSVNKFAPTDNADNYKNKKPSVRNNSQKILKRQDYKNIPFQAKYDQKLTASMKNKKSLGQSTEASPKSSSIKEYLKSRAPKVISQISSDSSISTQMRQLVITWIVQIVHKLPLKPQTLFHCILIFDLMLANYKSSNLSGMVICVQNLQLLALACLFISAKYEEIYPPPADLLVKTADYTYSKKKLIQMEANILLEQQFNLTLPTRYNFMEYLLNEQHGVALSKSKRLQHMCLLLSEISLLELWEQATQEELAQTTFFLAKKVTGINVEMPPRRICQLAWKLMRMWKERRNSMISFIFDSDQYSFVGGIYLQQI